MKYSAVVLLVLASACGALGQAYKPAYLRLCSRSDPKFDQCMVGRVPQLISNLIAGAPEIGLPSLNPFHLDELRLEQDIAQDVKVRMVINDVNIYGTDSATVTGVRSAFSDSRLDLDVGLMFPRLNIEGHYRSDVRFRGLPFNNKGAFNLSLSDVSLTLRMTGKPYQKDGDTYLQMQHVRMRPEIADLKISISNLFGGAKDLTSPAKQRDYTNCSPQWGDGVLYQGAVEKPSKLVQIVTFDLPVSTANAVIHCIKVVNTKPSSTPAAVSVTSGGTGYNFVTLHFQSERNHGIHYNVTISGK